VGAPAACPSVLLTRALAYTHARTCRYMENIFEELDAPAEWFYDEEAQVRRLESLCRWGSDAALFSQPVCP
jgi:hypothetical protein